MKANVTAEWGHIQHDKNGMTIHYDERVKTFD